MGWQHYLDVVDDHEENAPIIEFKNVKLARQSIVGRTVTGIASTFNVVDLGGDEVWPGAYTRTLKERRGKIRHLWGHSQTEPPIAVIRSLREVGRDELPMDIQRDFPTATGGLQVVREYLDTPRANEVLAGIKAGAITDMSIGYTIVRKDFGQRSGKRVRNLRDLDLFDVSDVVFGMNPATASAKRAATTQTSLDHLGLRVKLAAAWADTMAWK